MHKALLKLLALEPWLKGNEGLHNLLLEIMKETTSLNVEEFMPYTSTVYSETLSHRLLTNVTRQGEMLSMNMNLSSFVSILSDTATEFAKKGDNYTICFQTVFLSVISQLGLLNSMGISIPGRLTLTSTLR